MTQDSVVTKAPERGPTFTIDIEGTLHPWPDSTISVPQLRTLGDLPAGVEVQEINLHTNSQRTLPESEIVELQPGLGFSKKIEFRRG